MIPISPGPFPHRIDHVSVFLSSNYVEVMNIGVVGYGMFSQGVSPVGDGIRFMQPKPIANRCAYSF